jgi:Fe-S cluster assembly ATPase SufC
MYYLFFVYSAGVSADSCDVAFLTSFLVAINLSAEDRAKEGLFLAFQYPLEIEGVSNFDFLHLIYNEKKNT